MRCVWLATPLSIQRHKCFSPQLLRSRVRSVSAVPSFEVPFRVVPSRRPTTDFEEFSLKSIWRHQLSVESLTKAVEDEMAREKEDTEFHAKVAPKGTFSRPRELPKKERSPLKVLSPNFETTERARRRKSFDRKVKANKKQEEAENDRKVAELNDQENRAINVMRRTSIADGGLMFKASPIVTEDLYPTATPVSLPLTEAKSPFLLTKQRAIANK
jgi:Targeting protein for Xklp2 (TPX2) domain